MLNSQLANYSDFHTGDIAHIFWEGLQNLGIEKLFALIGGSIGGCIGWEFMAKFGDCVERFIPVATDWKASDWLIANTYLQDQILKNSSNPVHDARLHAMLCYRSPQSFADRFLRTFNEEENLFNVETWLRHHGEKLRKRFSTHSYLLVNHLLRSVNTERSGRPLEEIFSNSSTQFYLVGIDTDLFFIPSEIKETYEKLKTAGVAISYMEIQSPHGHDAFDRIRTDGTLVKTHLSNKIEPMNVSLERLNDDYLFEVTNSNGHRVLLDNKSKIEGSVKGISPMELLLMGLAGCSSIDVVDILNKQKINPTSLKMEVSGKRF